MRKLILAGLLVLATVAALPLIASAAAVGTCTQSILNVGNQTGGKVVTFSCVASADDASFPSTATDTAITAAINGLFIAEVRTNPGGTAPTNLYDMVLNDTDGIDLMGGALADRLTATSQRAIPILATGVYGTTMVDGALTLVITNNLVNSAIAVVKVLLTR